MRKLVLIFLIVVIHTANNNCNSQSFSWAKQTGGTNDDVGYSIAVDDSGNVYTAGFFNDTADFDPGPGIYNLISAGDKDIFVNKLDVSGNFLWAKRMGGSHSFGDESSSIATDISGNVYTTGTFCGTADFDPGSGLFNLTVFGTGSGRDIFVSKLDASGNFVWVKQIGGTSTDVSNSIARDASGNIYVSGHFTGTADFDPGPGTYFLTNGDFDFFVLKLDPSGNFLWAKQITSPPNCTEANLYLAVDAAGYVYTTGNFFCMLDFDPGPGVFNMTTTGNSDIFVLKLDPSGNFVWVKKMGGTNYDEARSVAVDATGNVIISGHFEFTADFDPGPGVFNLSVSNSAQNLFISKLDNGGNFVWAKQFASGSPSFFDIVVATDVGGNVYSTGAFQGSTDFDPGSGSYNLSPVGSWDIFISKLDAAGNFGWAGRMGGINGDHSYSIDIDANGNVYTTGTFYGTADFDPGAGTYNLTAAGTFDFFVSKLSHCTPPPAVITAGGPTTFCVPGSVTLSANTGTGITYQWRKNGVNISGAISSSYTATTSGNYECVVSDSCVSTTSNMIPVTVNPFPTASITAVGPVTFCSPGSVTLNANTGSGLSYQWRQNNVNIAGATSSSYVATASGSYNCIVTNSCGSTTSNSITVTALSSLPSAIITAGGPTTFCTPGSVALSANTGTGLTYQWRLNGGNISGAASVSYIATTPGNYDCMVTNACGSTFSNVITATVSGPCGIGLLFTSSANDRVTINDNAAFALGLGDFTMEAWIKASSSQSSSVPIIASKRGVTTNGFLLFLSSGRLSLQMAGINFGSTSNNLRDNLCHHVAVTRAANTIKFYVDGTLVTTLSIGNYNINSTHALWIGRDEPASAPFNGLIHEFRFWNLERSQTEILASKDIFLSGSEAGLVGYWKMDEGTGQTVVDYSPIGNSGVLGSSTSAESIDPAYTPGCMANICPLPPAVVTASGSATVCSPATVTLNANTGTGLFYQWRLNGGNITGATASSYIATSTGNYDCIVSNSCGSATSNTITVTINFMPTASITAAGPTTFCSPGSVTLNANTGVGLSHQWRLNGGNISGATSSSYNASASGNYDCIVSNACGSVASNVISVIVNPLPTAVITASGSTTVCSPNSVTLNANTGPGLSYQWRLNNTPIPGASNSSYIASVAGNYDCIVSNSCGSSTSNAIAINIILTGQYTWIQQADFGPGIREQAIGFSIGNKGYAGTGRNPAIQNDFWEYDPVTNTWTQKANVPGAVRYGAVGFSIGTQGYAGLGWTTSGQLNDFYEYDPSTNTWTAKLNFPGGARYSSVGISIGSKGYVGTGFSPLTNDWWEYDPALNTWTQKASQPATVRQAATGFSLNGFGYLGTGYNNGTHYDDFWRYDPVSNTWMQVANYPGGARRGVSSFTIGTQAYVGMGYNDINYFNDFWEYDPVSNSWTQIANTGGVPRYACFSFSVNGNGYVGTGSHGAIINPQSTSGVWKLNVPCSIEASVTPSGPIAICAAGSVVLSAANNPNNTYQWRLNGVDIPAATFSSYTVTAAGNYDCTVNCVCGSAISNTITVTFNFVPTAAITAAGPTTFCSPGSVTLNANTGPGLSYQWRLSGGNIPGATASSYNANATGNYDCMISNSCGNVVSNIISVTVNSLPAAAITAGGPTGICASGSVTLNANTGAGLSYQWRVNTVDIPGATLSSYTAFSAGNYDCIVTNFCGSTASNTIAITVAFAPATPGSITGQTTGVCSSVRTYSISAVPNATSYIWTVPPGATISSGQGTISVNVTFTGSFSSGNISVAATNSCGTSGTSSLAVTGAPAQPGNINGLTSVCHNQNNVIYNIAAVTGATSYTWTAPPGTQIKTGQGSVQIKVRFGNSAGNITVRANNSCGQSPVRTLAIAMPCREEEISDNLDVTLYPNPAKNEFRISNFEFRILNVEIFDALGQRIFSQHPEANGQELIVNVSGLPDGMYFAEITSGEQKKVLKFIKQK